MAEVGDPHSISLGLNFLVNTQIALKRYEEAKASMRESIALCEQTKNRWGMGTAYRYMGLATLAEGQYVEAQGYFQKSLEIFGEYFEGWDIALSLIYLGDATLMSGDQTEAERIYLKALRLAKETKSTALMLDALAGLALYDVRSGKNEQAWELSNVILNHVAAVQETKDRAAQIKEEAERYLSSEQLQAFEVRISNQSLDELVNAIIVK